MSIFDGFKFWIGKAIAEVTVSVGFAIAVIIIGVIGLRLINGEWPWGK